MFNFPATIANTLSSQLPPLMLLALYNPEVVGFYALANMLVVLPGSLISGSMGQAYLGEASMMVRERSRELRSLYVRTLKHLFTVAVPLIGIPALCAPFVVPFIFGKAWAEAGWYCWPLMMMVVGGFVIGSTTKLTIYGYNHWMLIFDVVRVIGVYSGFVICQHLRLSVMTTLTIYALVMVVMYIILAKLNLLAISNLDKSFRLSEESY